jgi:uncharacterized protein
MKNALILHGAGNNSQGNWFPWLKSELEKKGYTVWSPDLPNSETPDKASWLRVIFSNQDWVFNSQSVLVGHSAGSDLILRILEQLPEGVKINKAVLVAGPANLGTKPEYFAYKDLVRDPFNWEKIKSSAANFYFIHSDNDPYQCGIDQGKIFHEHLGGELILRPGQGHFNLEQGEHYRQFPLLIDLIEK